MGALGITGKTGEEHIDEPGEETPEEVAAPVEGAERGEDGRFVPAEKLVPETAASRRDRQWQERVAAQVKPLQEEWTKAREAYETRISDAERARQEQAQDIARLRGAIEAMQRQPQAQQAQPAGPDADKLYAEAEAALQANDYRTWQIKSREAMRAEATLLADERVKKVREEIQQAQPRQMPPHIQALMFRHTNVAVAGPRGLQAVMLKDQELAFNGIPDSPQRTAKAFELADAMLGGQQKQQQAPQRQGYDPGTAAALAGIPTGRATGGGNGAAGVTLTPTQAAAAKAGGMSAEEYLKWQDPYKHGLIKD